MNPSPSSRPLRGLPTPVDVVRGGFRVVEWQLDLARDLIMLPGRVLALIESAEDIVVRVQSLLQEAGRAVAAVDAVIVVAAQTVDEVSDVVRSADGVVGRVDGTVDAADLVIGRVDRTVTAADLVVGRVGGTVDSADQLVGRGTSLIEFGESAIAPVRPVVEALLVDAELDAESARRTAARLVEVLTWTDTVVSRLSPMVDVVLDSVDPAEVRALVELIDQLPEMSVVLRTDVMPVLASLDTVAPEVHELLAVAQECLEALAGIPGFRLLRRRGEDKIDDHLESAGDT